MKYIKKFENLELPEVGDYVIFNMHYDNDELSVEFGDFLNNNLGIIYKIYKSPHSGKYRLDVKYKNIPKKLKDFFI